MNKGFKELIAFKKGLSLTYNIVEDCLEDMFKDLKRQSAKAENQFYREEFQKLIDDHEEAMEAILILLCGDKSGINLALDDMLESYFDKADNPVEFVKIEE